MPTKTAAKKGSSRRKKHPAKKTVSKKYLRKLAVKKRRSLRPLHKRLALHPFNILFLLCVGVLLAAMSSNAIADSFDITAAADAPPLNAGAYITSPTDNEIVTTTPIVVDGTCPANSYVIVLRNGDTGGVAWCNDNTFSLTTGLYSGSNILEAQDYNITNNAGPATPNLSISYLPTATPVVTTGSINSTSSANSSPPVVASNAVPLLLTTNFTFRAFTTGSKYWTNISLAGGIPPYKIFINWGDGNTQTMALNSDPTFTIWHSYSKNGYFPIAVTATDSTGNKQWLQAAAFIRIPTATTFLTSPTSNSAKPNIFSRIVSTTRGWLIVIWPSYLVVILMVFCFWLGEKEAYKRMAQRFRGKKPKLKPSWRSR